MSWSSRRALALSDLRDVGPGLVEVDVEVGVLLGRREDIEVLQGGADLGRAARPVEPLAERLARGPFTREARHDAHHGLGRGLGRELRGLLAELDLHLADVAT